MKLTLSTFVFSLALANAVAYSQATAADATAAQPTPRRFRLRLRVHVRRSRHTSLLPQLRAGLSPQDSGSLALIGLVKAIDKSFVKCLSTGQLATDGRSRCQVTQT